MPSNNPQDVKGKGKGKAVDNPKKHQGDLGFTFEKGSHRSGSAELVPATLPKKSSKKSGTTSSTKSGKIYESSDSEGTKKVKRAATLQTLTGGR